MSNLEDEIIIPLNSKRLRHDNAENNLEDEIIIQPDSKRLRHDGAENKNEDRLSHFPDCVLIHILKFLNTKDAVRISILSPRFKHIWKHIPTLILHSSYFSTLEIFTTFVSKVFSLRDHLISLHCLHFSDQGTIELPLLKRILEYAISHNVQALIVNREIDQIPSSIFSCQTLTHLMLKTSSKIGSKTRFFPKSLKIVELCTPSLRSFIFTGVPHMRFRGNNLSSVKHVDIDADLCSVCEDPAFNLFSWLQNFVGIKSMVITASTLQVLSFIPDLLKPRLRFLENLNSLKVLDQELSIRLCTILRLAKLQKGGSLSRKEAVKQLIKENKELKVKFTPSPPLPDGIADFLLQNSPSAEVDIFDLSR